MNPVSLGEQPLDLSELVALSRSGSRLSLAAETLEKVRRSRRVVEQAVASGEAIYGVNTGFGKLAGLRIEADDLGQLQRNLLLSHATGVGASLPGDWQVAETNGAGTMARWAVVEAAGGESGRALSLEATINRGRTYNLVLLAETYPADLTLGVRVRADSGAEDQGGGLVWRAVDADNYYICRWNPLEDNLRAYKVVGGRRTQLLSADVSADPDGWHRLQVAMTGPRMEVWLDDVLLLSGQDDTFMDGGRVGLWTKADAATSFDNLVIGWGK